MITTAGSIQPRRAASQLSRLSHVSSTDVAVPADRALDTAYLAALDKVKRTIDPKKRPGMAKEIDEAIAKLKSAAK